MTTQLFSVIEGIARHDFGTDFQVRLSKCLFLHEQARQRTLGTFVHRGSWDMDAIVVRSWRGKLIDT